MRKARKLALTIMSVLFALTFVLGLAACGGQSAKDAIDAYLLPQDNQLVDADFTLPKKIGIDNGVNVEWKSDKAAIAIEDGGEEAETYTAKVTLQDAVTSVKLTVSSGGASKDFTVRVDALTVFTFMKRYTNEAFSAPVKDDFKLDSSFTIQGKTAHIDWTAEAGQTYLTVITEGDDVTVKVAPGDDLVKVKLTATFTYGEAEPATTDYEVSVSPVLDHRQTVNKLYSEAGFPIEFDGYVVHVYVAANDSQYGPMASFFAVDSDFCSGYYIWQAALESADDVEKVVPGAHFTFSGDYAKNYNGLWETNGYEAGTAVFDGATPIDINEHIRAFDLDLITGVQSAKWQMSRLVSVTGWKVQTEATDDGKGNITVTLENGGKTVDIYLSSYVAVEEEVRGTLKAKLEGLKAGDVVDVKGILGYYDSGATFDTKHLRIQPRTADDVTAATAAATYPDATKIAAAQTAVNDKVKEKFGGILKDDTTVEMPTVDGVTITYRLAKAVTEGAPVVITGNSIAVTPQATDKTCLIEVTYAIKDGETTTYSAQSIFEIRSWKAEAADIVEEVYKSLNKTRIDAITHAGEFDLPEKNIETYGATITWRIENAPAWAEIDAANKKLVIKYLPMTASTLKVYAKISYETEEAKDEVFFNVKVSAAPTVTFKAITEGKAGTYKLAMYSANKGATYYATGSMDGYYFATSLDIAEAADFVVTQIGTDNKYTITINGKYLEFAPAANGKSNSVDINMEDTQTEGKYWKWIEGIQNFVFESAYNKDGDTTSTETQPYYFGTYSSYTTMSGNYITRIATKGDGDDVYTPNDAEGVSQWVAHFGTLVEATDETRANEVLAKLKQQIKTSYLESETVTLPTTEQYGAVIAYSLSNVSDANAIKLSGTTLTLTQGNAEATAKLTISVTVKEEAVTEEITITLAKIVTVTFKPIETAAAGSYILSAVYQDEKYYVSSLDLSGNYLATSKNIEDAVELTIEQKSDSATDWYIKMGSKYLEINPYANSNTSSGVSYNFRLVDTPTSGAVWVFDTTNHYFKQKPVATGDLGGKSPSTDYYYIGNYDTSKFTTFSPSSEYYITGDKSSALDTTQHPARFGTLEEMNDQDRADEVAASLKLDTTTFSEVTADGAGITLPTSDKYGATVTWAVTGTNDGYIEITSDNILKILKLATDEPVQITIKATVTVGSEKAEQEITITVGVEVDPNAYILTTENVFKDITGSSYTSYNVAHTVDGYDVRTYQVMRKDSYAGASNVFQFQANNGELTVGGNFTKVTIKFFAKSMYANTQAADKPVVIVDTASDEPSTPELTQEKIDVDTGMKDDSTEVYSHTVSVTLTGDGLKCVTIKKNGSGALYIESIEFTKATDAVAHAHSMGSYTSKDEDTHTRSCTGCGYTEESDHRYADNDDTNCEDCNYERTIDNTVWVKVTDVSQLVAGKEYVLINGTKVISPMGTFKYFPELDGVTTSGEGVRLPAGYQSLTLGGESGAWTLSVGNKKLVLTGTSNNNLALKETPAATDKASTWTIEFTASGEATITAVGTGLESGSNTLRYNGTNTRFSNYKSTSGDPLFLYVKGDA